jgi:CheY-like chemotaxis protein
LHSKKFLSDLVYIIILCTGFSARIDEQKAMAMGIRAFVSKPILKREIAETIRKVLGT